MIKVTDTIDHTVLKPSSKKEDISKVCREATEYSFAAVCIPPNFISFAKKELSDLKSTVKVATVIGFPFGYSCVSAKAAEALDALEQGCDEIDMVANISAIKEGRWEFLTTEVKTILDVMKNHGNGSGNCKLKVIIESGILSDDEIIQCCKIYGDAGINYLKTSTGYAENKQGASVEHVKLFRQHLPDHVKIKASGGIRTYETARQMIEAGADRLGCSAGVAIAKEMETGERNDSAQGAY
jgi:deoxyribose-phosphate aldolase